MLQCCLLQIILIRYIFLLWVLISFFFRYSNDQMLCTDNCRSKICKDIYQQCVYQYLSSMECLRHKIYLNVNGNIPPSSVSKNMINLSSGKNLAYQGFLIHSKQDMNWDVNDFQINVVKFSLHLKTSHLLFQAKLH